MTRVGTVLCSPDPVLAEFAGEVMDVAWIDLEHGALGLRDAQTLAIALQAHDCAAWARVPSFDSALLAPVLDAGFDGVVVPRIERAEEVEALVARTALPPLGRRGYGPRRGAPGAPVEIVVQVETLGALAAIEAIAAVPGVDALVVGCSDLSYAVGAPRRLDAPELTAAVRATESAARRAGRAFGLAGGGPAAALAGLAGEAPDLLVGGTDLSLYREALARAARTLTTAAEAIGAAA